MKLKRWAGMRPEEAVDPAKQRGFTELSAESNVSHTMEV